MAPKRLSDPEKQEIIRLYRHPEETTSTLASRFGVSNSTISRILKQTLAADEYDDLVQQKRTGSSKSDTASDETQLSLEAQEPESAPAQKQDKEEPDPSNGRSRKRSGRRKKQEEPSLPAAKEKAAEAETPSQLSSDSVASPDAADDGPVRRRRRRSVSSSADEDPAVTPSDGSEENPAAAAQPSPRGIKKRLKLDSSRSLEEADEAEAFDLQPSYPIYTEAEALAKDLDEELLSPEDDFTDLDEDEDDEDEDDFNDLDEDDDIAADQGSVLPSLYFQSENLLRVQPFSAADLPRSCYLVIDRSAELITRPLEDFAELGQIPNDELTERTLPIFDNHRVAKRFANRRTQRIVKIPDSRVLQKASPYLQAKGITRLLIDGQVYSLDE